MNKNRTPENTWSDKEIEELKKYAVLDLSCSEIAIRMKRKSRNAIIGKLHRLKIERPLGRRGQGRKKKLTFDQPPLVKGLKNINCKISLMKGDHTTLKNYFTPSPEKVRHRNDIAHIPKQGESVPIDESGFVRKHGMSLLKAGVLHCRWPLEGKAKDGQPRCCGMATVKGAYCDEHYKRVHSKTAGGAKPLDTIE